MRRVAAIMLGFGAMLATGNEPANAIPLSATRLGNPIPKSTPMQLGSTVVAPIAASTVAVMAPLSALQIGFLADAALYDRRTGPLPRPAPVAVCAVR